MICYSLRARDARDTAGEHEEAADGLVGRVDGLDDAKAEDEDETYEGEGVEADEEEGGPAVFVTEECTREPGEDEDGT